MGCCHPLHIITAQKNIAFSRILRHSCLQLTQCPLSNLKEFIVFPVSAGCTDLLCAVVKYFKVACAAFRVFFWERSNAA